MARSEPVGRTDEKRVPVRQARHRIGGGLALEIALTVVPVSHVIHDDDHSVAADEGPEPDVEPTAARPGVW
ncbi:hypothetical protein FAIPA1_30239 [Frankia sp. AiPs1]